LDEGCSVQEVDYAQLRDRLLKEGAILGPSAEPPPAQLVADVQVLVQMQIVGSGNYWLTHARPGQDCEGSHVASLLLAMARTFEAVDTTDDAVRVLVERQVLGSAKYWQERAVPGGRCKGDYVGSVIRNFVRTAQ